MDQIQREEYGQWKPFSSGSPDFQSPLYPTSLPEVLWLHLQDFPSPGSEATSTTVRQNLMSPFHPLCTVWGQVSCPFLSWLHLLIQQTCARYLFFSRHRAQCWCYKDSIPRGKELRWQTCKLQITCDRSNMHKNSDVFTSRKGKKLLFSCFECLGCEEGTVSQSRAFT